jgi:hypothetical protein
MKRTVSLNSLLNNGQFAVRAPAPTPDSELENVLRASVAREENRKMAHEDLYEAIEKRRSELLEDLARARNTRDEINTTIKRCQDALDNLPVPRMRRKSPGRKLADAVVTEIPFEATIAGEMAAKEAAR